MKKIIGNILKLFVITILLLSINSYAASLDNIDISVDKTNIKPGEEVIISISFGESLGAYTFNISYDDNIFEFVSAEGGTANDTGDKVIVVFFDSTGGSAPRTNMSITFKAKNDITTSNPTEFLITAEGLSNPDVSETFDEISVPIVKNVTVEPVYADYILNLEPTGEVQIGSENKMKISFSSSLGRYYEHARLIATATTPEGGDVSLIGIDNSGAEHDIIQSGWGDAGGFGIGGKDYLQLLNVIGKFSKIGEYKVNLKLIDRDNSDSIIVEKSFSFSAVEKANIEDNTKKENVTSTIDSEDEENKIEITDTNTSTKNTTNKIPARLPKTGINIFVPSLIILFSIIVLIIYYNKR